MFLLKVKLLTESPSLILSMITLSESPEQTGHEHVSGLLPSPCMVSTYEEDWERIKFMHTDI